MNVGQVETALAGATSRAPSKGTVQSKLLELYPSLVEPLAACLEARKKQMVEGLRRSWQTGLRKRPRTSRRFCSNLKKSIEAELKDPAYAQGSLFDDPEKERFERNKDAMRSRAQGDPRGDRAGDCRHQGSVR